MIKTVGEGLGILNNYNAKNWVSETGEGGHAGKGVSLAASEGKGVSGMTDTGNLLNIYGERADNTTLDMDIKSPKTTFGRMLAESLSRVNELQQDANVAIEKLAVGESENLHETMLIVEQAEIAFKMMNQIRQKVLDAYKEVMRMQI
ncbi:MAG: flagellar hook-basal body complex protein FliE [Oligoflexia bacterium]|nr:flagellar hook-basal body complex protein FliE [Oligoflexia bacterium]